MTWIAHVLVAGAIWSLLSLWLFDTAFGRLVTIVFDGLAVPVGPSLFSAVLLLAIAGPIRRRSRCSWAGSPPPT